METWQCVMGFSVWLFLIFFNPVKMCTVSRAQCSHSVYPLPCFMCTCKVLSVSHQARLILQSSSTEAESIVASRQAGPEAWVAPTSTHPPEAWSTGRQAERNWGGHMRGQCVGGRWSWTASQRKRSLTNEQMKETGKSRQTGRRGEGAHLSLFWLNLFSLIAPITKDWDKRLKLLYSKNFQSASSQCSALCLIYLRLQ